MTSAILSKVCSKCKQDKSVHKFYVRSGIETPTLPGHYNSECMDCMRGRDFKKIHPLVPRASHEILAIEYLKSHGIPTLPGKAVHAADVDVVSWGHVWIEVKYSKLEIRHKNPFFRFNLTPKQKQRGFRAHIVMLICEYPDGERTFHLFPKEQSVFYMSGRLKTGFHFTPGATHALKHGRNRVVMTQQLMDEAQDRLDLIPIVQRQISDELKVWYSVQAHE